jgi:hypothetical protein
MLCEKNILLNLATFRKSGAKCFAKKIFCSTLQLLEKVAQNALRKKYFAQPCNF